jgi:hypothetical protein
MQVICVDEILEALPRKWVLGEILEGLRRERKSSRPKWRHFKTVYRPSVWLPSSIFEADGSRLRLPAYDLQAILGLPNTLGGCTNEQAQNVLPSAASQICATPQSSDDASVSVQVCLLMQASPQPCTRPVNASLAVFDSSGSDQAHLQSAWSSCTPMCTPPGRLDLCHRFPAHVDSVGLDIRTLTDPSDMSSYRTQSWASPSVSSIDKVRQLSILGRLPSLTQLAGPKR